MRHSQARVSVIMPVYNGALFLAEAVQSIRQQEHAPTEIIIVDDGSTDGTAGVAASFSDSVRYAYQANRGPAAARNTGLGMAAGDVIGFLDSDDLWTGHSLGCRLGHLARNPSVDIVMGYTQLIRAAHTSDEGEEFTKIAAPWPVLSLGSALMRRSVFDVAGPFDESLPYSEDVDWFLRAREAGVGLLIVPDVVQLYRRHKDNITNLTDLTNQHFLYALKQSLDRRRQKADGSATPLPGWLTPDESLKPADPIGTAREPGHDGK